MSIILNTIKNHEPACLAVIDDVRSLTYGDLNQEIEIKAKKLKNVTVLGLALDNSVDWVIWDLATVKAIADEIVVMLNGRIVEQGVKKEVLTPPYHKYTEVLLSSVPEMDPGWLDNLLAERQALNHSLTD